MQVANGVNADYKDGKIVIEVEVAKQINPFLDATIAKIESGEIDLVKGTDIDKVVALQVLGLLKAYANK